MRTDTRTRVLVSASAIAGASCTALAGGAYEAYDTRAEWLAAVSGPVVTEGFEGLDALGPLDAPSYFESGLGLAATEQAAAFSRVEFGDPGGYGLQNTTVGGRNYIRFGSGGGFEGDYTMQYLLPQTSNAFAFDISDWEPGLITIGSQGADISLLNDGQLLFSFFLPGDEEASGTLDFVGFTSFFMFDEVRFTINEIASNLQQLQPFVLDVTGVDEVSWVVPAPGAAALLGLAGFTAMRRRR